MEGWDKGDETFVNIFWDPPLHFPDDDGERGNWGIFGGDG